MKDELFEGTTLRQGNRGLDVCPVDQTNGALTALTVEGALASFSHRAESRR